MSRTDKRTYYLNIATVVSTRSTCLKRHYGAVIVNNEEIVSTGYNGSPRGVENCCDRGTCYRNGKEHNTGDYSECCSVHAEQNAIISAGRARSFGGTLYLVGVDADDKLTENPRPCPICERMIRNAGIKRVVTPFETIGIS